MTTYSKDNLTTMIQQRIPPTFTTPPGHPPLLIQINDIFSSDLTGSSLFMALDTLLNHYSL